jgi:hypothetical protein
MRRTLNWLAAATSLGFLWAGLTLARSEGSPAAACYRESDGVYLSRPALYSPAVLLSADPAETGTLADADDPECYLRGGDAWATYWSTPARS